MPCRRLFGQVLADERADLADGVTGPGDRSGYVKYLCRPDRVFRLSKERSDARATEPLPAWALVPQSFHVIFRLRVSQMGQTSQLSQESRM
jgi:hypothetical protein